MQPRHKVLGVDDNPTNLAILAEILSDDYEFHTAGSGEEALEAAPRLRPDVVLLDIMMPGIDGYEVCREIRKDSRLRHTKVIMVSAKAHVSERLRGYEVGADDYVVKPFDEEELRFKVQVFVKLKSVQEVDQLKTEILSLLSHETRTPLKSVMVPASLLMSAETMTDEMRRRLGEVVHRNATRLHGFFDRLLTLSMLRSGQWRKDFTVLPLAEVVREAVRAVSDRAAENAVRIAVACSQDPRVSASREDLVSVVEAILDNAVGFSPRGGTVEVTVAADADRAVVSVSDHGRGVAPELLPRIFDEFADRDEFADAELPFDADIDRYIHRYGLSLAIAKHVVDKHGGEITVESERDVKTTFTVRLPLCRVCGGPEAADGMDAVVTAGQYGDGGSAR